MAVRVACLVPYTTRSIFPAPMFWPAKVVMALPKENAGSITKPSTRMTMTLAAMYCSPKLLVRDWTTIRDMEKIAWVTPEGRPRRIREPLKRFSGIRYSFFMSKMWPMRISFHMVSTAETSWAMMVAQATPATPMESLATNT